MDNNYFVSTLPEIDNVINQMEMAGIQLPVNSELSFTVCREDFKKLPLPKNMITASIAYTTKLGILVRINTYGK